MGSTDLRLLRTRTTEHAPDAALHIILQQQERICSHQPWEKPIHSKKPANHVPWNRVQSHQPHAHDRNG
jgi:hypothetical protein